MSRLIINGGNKLSGRVKVSGAKNAALAIIAAAILTGEETVLENVPRISDVEILLDILKSLGAEVTWLTPDTVALRVPDEVSHIAPYRQVRRLRASNLLLGPLLARKKTAEISLPGGCEIGSRPMDLHLKGLTHLGSEIYIEHGFIKAKCQRLTGARIYLDFPSVGATENIMMAATMAEKLTIIENAAKEPEIVDLAMFLNAMGAKVRGAGTDVVKIEGGRKLRATRYAIIPDRIEAGTFMVAAAITGGDITIENVIPTHLQPMIAKLREAGVDIEEKDLSIRVRSKGKTKPIDIKTMPYPGFPTDMQSQMMALMSVTPGTSVIVENVFENRMQVAEELRRMGANIKVEGQTAVVLGVPELTGAKVKSCDLRSGAALILAALTAQGTSEIHDLELIDRGYVQIEEKLKNLGADIVRVD